VKRGVHWDLSVAKSGGRGILQQKQCLNSDPQKFDATELEAKNRLSLEG
jgi:hypothetical protein